MASWLKVAEDLLEVVDRRAKLVASDPIEEQIDIKPPVSNGQEFKGKKKKTKGKLGRSTNEPIKRREAAPEQTSVQASGESVLSDTDKMAPSSENAGAMSSDDIIITSKELQLDVRQDGIMSVAPLPDTLPDDVGRTDGVSNTHTYTTMARSDGTGNMETASTANNLELVGSSSTGEVAVESTANRQEVPTASILMPSGVESVNGDHPIDAGQNIKSCDVDVPLKVDHEVPEVGTVQTYSTRDIHVKDADLKEEPPSDLKKQESIADTSSMRVQEQLDEAQGLLKSAISTGQSKEARLAKVCAGLSSRLQEYKSENAQLEELLSAERERTNSYEFHIKQLQKELSMSKIEVSRVESNMAEALSAKNSEIEALVNSMDAVKKQATISEGKLASLQANMESIMRNRELTETRVMQAIQEELASAERRAEEEHAAHNATKKAAMEREVELEHRAVEASTALARMQRNVDERTSKVAELEQKLALLEAESASLNQELQDMEARARRGQKRSTEEANQALQVQAWQEEVERARQGQRDAESKLSSLEAEVQKMRVEMAGMKRDAEHYSRQEHMELEKRYRELTDLLYHKQTQLETMASEKAAAEFQLEKEMKRLQEAQVEMERSRAPRRTSLSYWEEDTDLKTLEPLPLYHRHIAGASLQLQKAAKLLDSGAVRATKFLWRYPVARVTLFFYMVFVHLFLMYLLHRLQEQADDFAAREVAASMGLSIPNLP